jgi:APA family basic amino acid/polyamine antiporter
MTVPAGNSLSRILGFGFSIALAFGGTVGVGILSLPGEVAAALGDVRLIIGVWIVGGVYALLGAVSIAELSSMLPQAGGFSVYARRAFGRPVGFVVGWNDWVMNCVAIAYAAYTAADILAALVPGTAGHGTIVAIACIALPTMLHWIGIRIGSTVQNVISSLVGVLLVVLALGCLFATPAPVTGPGPAAPVSVANLPLLSAAMVTAFAAALRSVIVTYDGWYTAIYLSEETVDAPRNVPRAMISCALLVTMLYVLINIGFVHALSLPVLAASPLPAADAARLILPEGGAAFVTFLSLLTIMGLINAVMLGAPRILFGVLRDGIANGRALAVSDGGTPRVALLASSLLTVGLVLARTRGQLIDIAAVLYVLDYLSGYASLFVLRWREPDLPRPFRAPFYPWATGFVFVGSIAFLVAAIADNRVTGFGALALIALAAPVGWWLGRDRATAT